MTSGQVGPKSFFLRHEFQQIADFTFQHRTYPGEDVNIQSGYAVVAIIVDL
jgi:hypothetical protein